MLRQLNRSTGGRRILGTPYTGLEAALIAAQTASGDNGPGLLYDDAIDPVNAGKRLRLEITSRPALGTLFVAENGMVELSGAPAGTYTAGYNVKADNVFVKADIATFDVVAVGTVDATAPATTVTGTSTINAGVATGGSGSGTVNATAPATTVNGASTINAGQATGQQNATAPETIVTGVSSINASQATGGNGNVDATAPATTVNGTSTIDAGQATGQRNATAPETIVTGASSINAGNAIGDHDATAPATTVTGTSTITAGVATGDAPSMIIGYRLIPSIRRTTTIHHEVSHA